MKTAFTTIFPLALATAATATPIALEKRDTVYGFDVSHYQGTVDFKSAYSTGGLRFVYIKATQGTTYTDPDFSSHYSGATAAGFIRGGYHYADGGDPAAEAKYFLAHGGGWSSDGKTLPGMLDLEGDCKSVSWIQTFSNTYHTATGVYPVIYTSPSWWSSCTGNSGAFVNTNPLFLARYASSPGTLPGGWPYYTFWQYADSNTYGGDSDRFNGGMSQLQALASG